LSGSDTGTARSPAGVGPGGGAPAEDVSADGGPDDGGGAGDE
jgi:hypothetical protein